MRPKLSVSVAISFHHLYLDRSLSLALVRSAIAASRISGDIIHRHQRDNGVAPAAYLAHEDGKYGPSLCSLTVCGLSGHVWLVGGGTARAVCDELTKGYVR